MELNIGKEITSLYRMAVGELRTKYAEAFGDQTRANNKAWLVKRITWRIQSRAEGDLSERARKRAAELADDADLRLSAPKLASNQIELPIPRLMNPIGKSDQRLPLAGTIITRQYKGQTLQVKVLASGFEFEGEVYKSLSAVAKAITGSHCNGYLFFRLGEHGGCE